MTQPSITPETARHVLWHWGQPGGYQPGSFTQSLMCTIDRADYVHTALLRTIYPALVAALKDGDADTVARLQKIARGVSGDITCRKCSDADGPFEARADHYLCEGCIKAGVA
jgi:hypothetical protein